jgi:ABC-type Mn2+/Zn2+ transport system permease subunit/Mn-dependent DtxR family transcriptional regulator
MNWTEWLQIFEYSWAQRAIIASCLVGTMGGLLGSFIVLRNMSLIGDALAHAILPGVVFAFILVGYSTIGFFAGSVIAGLLTAVVITWIQQNVSTKNDAAIGIVFTAMFSIGVMGISYISRNEGVHLDLKDFLFGNVLGVSDDDLMLTGMITILVIGLLIIYFRPLFVTTFQPIIAQTMGISVSKIHYLLMLLLSFSVVASLQTVGVILVVAMLITPSSTALLLSNRLKIVVLLSAFFGLLAAVGGLLAAIAFETTPGPAMAVVATMFYVVAIFFSPKKGLIFQQIRKYQFKQKILMEDGLKTSYRLAMNQSLTKGHFQENMNLSDASFARLTKQLQNKGYLTYPPLSLTDKGKKAASQLVRAHRLWETYLVDKVGIAAEHIHDHAEKYEHVLSEEMVNAVDKELGYPHHDPHGSPIPADPDGMTVPLKDLPEYMDARIATVQINEHISAVLWELGILPHSVVKEKSMDEEGLWVRVNGQRKLIPNEIIHELMVHPLYPSDHPGEAGQTLL